MYNGYLEEGDKCPKSGCGGVLDFIREKACSCHINPPCSACTDAELGCEKCGFKDESEPEKYVSAGPGISMRVNKPKPLDNTKVDYRCKSNSNSSMIKEGVYPEGMSREEVEAVVKGTFGGRFSHFGGGKFKYIAYTD